MHTYIHVLRVDCDILVRNVMGWRCGMVAEWQGVRHAKLNFSDTQDAGGFESDCVGVDRKRDVEPLCSVEGRLGCKLVMTVSAA